ncbi:MAG: hypothetical protein DI538_08275 [Azospira oryzae]|nr:MAG: hypothetical protein DI538_08275 [Azospira oryzae]
MTEQRTPMILKITPYVGLFEKIFLTGLTIGLALTYFNAESKTIIQISVLGLAITYFLTAFKTIDIPRKEDEIFGFKDLFASTIAPKVIWISCGVSLFGLFIYTLQLGHDGHKQAFMVGGSSIAMGLIIIGYSAITGTKHLSYILPTIIRASPLLIVDFYLLYN